MDSYECRYADNELYYLGVMVGVVGTRARYSTVQCSIA